MSKAKTKSDLDDDLGSVIAGTLNKDKSDINKTVYDLSTDLDAPTHVTGWVSTGSTVLDFLISNRKHGGFPVGKISEVTGLEGSGKSLLAAHALVDTQRQGGIAVYIDTESAVDTQFWKAIGIDVGKVLYIPVETVEQIFERLEKIIDTARKSDKNRLVTVVIDSVAGASTETEVASDFGKDGYATAKAIILSKAMRKITNMIARQRICLIFTNQLRMKMDAVGFGAEKYCVDPYTTRVKIRYKA